MSVKKVISLLLCMCMVCGCGVLNAFAINTNTAGASNSADNVLFSDDFESYKDGDTLIVKKDVQDKWTKMSNAATTKIAAYKDETGMVMRLTNTNTEGSNGPRFEKHFDFSTLSNLTISFRMRSTDCKGAVTFYTAGGSKSLVAKNTASAWVSYKFVFNFQEMTYDMYTNDKLTAEKTELSVPNLSEVQVRFSATISADQEACFDDIVISTTDNVVMDAPADAPAAESTIITEAEALAKFDQTPAPTLAVPEGKYTWFNYDCSLNADNKIPTSSDANFKKISTTEYIKPAVLGKDKIIRATNAQTVEKQPRLEKHLALGAKPDKVTLAFYAQLSDSRVRVHAFDTAGKEFASTSVGVKASGEQSWDLAKFEIDFEKKTITTYQNGKQVEVRPFHAESQDYSNIQLRIYPVLQPRDTILMDNFIIYSESAPDYGDVKYYGETGTNWSKIGMPVNYMANLNAHPRLFINSRQEVVDKIASDDQCAQWYNSVKQSADVILVQPCNEYVFSNGRNILSAARSIERRMMTLGFTYLVEQDRKYVERGLKEIRYAGTFPDWSNGAPMIPSELMYGVALFYDWCYDALTPEERTEIIDILKKQALWQFVRSYEGTISVEIAKGNTNRTMIANTSAAGIALAIADEEPELAEFLFTYGIKHGRQPVEAFGADGGFPEGPSYWGLATEFMVYMLAQLESAFKPEYVKPADITWYFENPVIENMGDYWVYTAGPIKSFNFGDASESVEADPTPLWLAARYNKPLYNWASAHLEEKTGSLNYQYFAILYKDANVGTSVEGVPLDKTFNAKDDAQVATFRSSWTDDNALFAAMQGGYNSASHMFKSLGNFVIDANGQRFIRTIGRSDYSALYDDNMYYNKRAEGQNTIIANPGQGWDQEPKAYAKFVRHEEAENEAFSVLDMTATNLNFEKAMRGMYMTKGRNSIVLQDEVKMKKPSELWWFAHTDGALTLSADKKSAIIEIGGKKMYAAITAGPADAQFEIMKARPLPTSPVALDEVYQDIFKLAIHMQNVTETTLAVEFVPLGDGEVAPGALTQVTPIDSWKVADNSISTARQAGDAVVMLLGSPVVLDKGNRTYVDTANMDVMPFTQNGRTLVPVRFISEAFGANVGWDDATQTVSVEKGSKSIRLQIGSDKMYVNGEERILDVPAQTINSRTLIPLRALVEALGKHVFWDDRGLISIADNAMDYTEAERVNVISMLSARVLLNGVEMKNFTTDKTSYVMALNGAVPTVTLTNGAAVMQNGNTASFTIGDKVYTITFEADKFASQIGTNHPGLVNQVTIKKNAGNVPSYPTWQSVAHVTFSSGHDKYVEFGTVDNIISNDLVNRWSGSSPAWICYEFAEPVSLYAFGLAGMPDSTGNPRGFVFKAEVSMDGQTWEQVLDTRTSGTTNMPDIFKLNGKTAKYFRINGFGDANGGSFNSYTEVRFYTSEAQMNEDISYWPVYFGSDNIQGAVGTTTQVKAEASNALGAIVSDAVIVYETDKPEIATVDANGVITFKAKGTTTLTVKCNTGYGEVSASATIEAL